MMNAANYNNSYNAYLQLFSATDASLHRKGGNYTKHAIAIPQNQMQGFTPVHFYDLMQIEYIRMNFRTCRRKEPHRKEPNLISHKWRITF